MCNRQYKARQGLLMDVFTAFQTSAYTFMVLNQGGVRGNAVDSSYEATGIFKEREGMVVNANLESMQADATLHVRPNESFLSGIDNYMVGHGVSVNGRNYRVIGQTGGHNYHNNVREHYTVTLKREELA